MGEAKQKLLDAEGKLAEERLQVVEDRRKLEEQKQKFQQEMEQRQKDEQNLILGKKLGSGHKGNIQKYTRLKFIFGLSKVLRISKRYKIVNGISPIRSDLYEGRLVANQVSAILYPFEMRETLRLYSECGKARGKISFAMKMKQ